MFIKTFTKYGITLVAISVSILGYIKDSNAVSILLDRGLPTTNLNNTAGTDRSNVVWNRDNINQGFSGDSFVIGNLGETYIIDEIQTWIVAAPVTLANYFIGNSYKNINLFGGLAGNNLNVLSSGNLSLGSNVTDNSNINVSKITYSDSTSYQNIDSNFYNLYQINFTNLNWLVQGGKEYYFGAWGEGKQINATIFVPWFNHASNAGLSGSTQQGSNNKYIYFTLAFDGSGNLIDANFEQFWDSKPIAQGGNGGWDKSSDINVKIFGDQIPFEMRPGTGLIILGSLLVIKQFLKKKN